MAHHLDRTRPDQGVLLQFIAYGCLFFLVLLYPFGRSSSGRDGAKRFCRMVSKAVVAMGLLAGCLALLEQVFWNGRILWFFVPYDWGGPRADMAGRAIGPFVNPDHFAGYLNMILPLALGGALFRNFLSRRPSRESFRVFCAAAAFVLILAIELSLSRAGWIGGLLGFSIIIWLALLMRVAHQKEFVGPLEAGGDCALRDRPGWLSWPARRSTSDPKTAPPSTLASRQPWEQPDLGFRSESGATRSN